jgi:hypothetical protein
VAQAVHDEQNNTGRHSSSGGISSLPSRSFRYLQEQYDDDHSPTVRTTVEVPITLTDHAGLRRSSDGHTPSRSFKFLQDQYPMSSQSPSNQSQAVNNREDLIEIYNKRKIDTYLFDIYIYLVIFLAPPSFRAREPEARRYTGSTIPSRSFRFLQMMTQDDQQNDSKPVSGYTKPQASLFNKYDEQNLSTNTNHLHEHPSRSFKYLQEITGEHKSTTIKPTDMGTSDF